MQTDLEFLLPNRRATRTLAALLAEEARAADLIVLSGPLGSGKTFLCRAFCRALGVPREQRVTSPTFALVHEYAGRVPISHADVYRIRDERELFELGLAEQRDDGRLLIVEWGEPFVAALGGDALVISLALDPRRAALRASGPRSQSLAAALRAKPAWLDAAAAPG